MPSDDPLAVSTCLAAVAARPAGQMPRYNEVQQKSVHNAYERFEPMLDQIVWSRAHSVELDIHNGRRGHGKTPDDWFVYHVDAPTMNATSCYRLSDCLGQMRAYHQANPHHEVVTILLDLKDDFEAGRMPADLDRRILAHLSRDWIATPGDLVSVCPEATTLQAAIRGGCGWPRLDALRGKFIFAVTNSDACDPESAVSSYVDGGSAALQRIAFAAPDVTPSCPLEAYLDKRPYVGMVNMNFANVGSAERAHDAGLVTRVYYGGLRGGLDDEASWNVAKRAKVNLLVTDRVNFLVDPWTVTHNARGWPFTCFDGCPADLAEDVPALGVTVDSGDIAGTSDDFFFAARDERDAVQTWAANVSVPSSHTDDLGKACLMARGSEAPGAAYFALCRTTDDHPLRVQFRAREGGRTEVRNGALAGAALSPESPLFARISLHVTGDATEAQAEGSSDGVNWTMLATARIGAALVRQGIAASSHGSGPMRLVFGALSRAGERVRAADLAGTKIGACRGGRLFDGIF